MSARKPPVPEQLFIGGKWWDVKSVPDLTDDDESLYGHCSPRHLLIRYDPDQAPGQLRDTILHEVLHAILADTPAVDNEEASVAALTPHLLAVLRLNPALVKFLMHNPEGTP